jgi:uncharacterized membrane protein (DUF4010 family)
MDLDLAQRLGVALAVGFVIGAERGWEGRELPPGGRTAGVRTFALVGLLGGIAALLAERFGAAVLAVTLGGVLVLAAASYVVGLRRDGAGLGITTEVALLLTCALGAVAGSGSEREATVAAVVTTAILGFKRELHEGIAWLERREIVATLQLLLIAAVAIPLLPDHTVGPLDVLHPRRIGLLVLLVAGVSYVGWFAVRLLGERAGLLLTAALGGLTSSTALTLGYARMAREARGQVDLLAAGIQLACAVMAVRLAVLVAVVEPRLAARLAPALAALALVPAGAALLAARAARGKKSAAMTELPLRNPLQLEAALLLAALITGLTIAVRAAERWLGSGGVYAVAALSGVADVDALGLSMAQSARDGMDLHVAALAVTLAASVNTAAKAGMAAAIGGAALARACAPALLGGLALAVALAAWL